MNESKVLAEQPKTSQAINQELVPISALVLDPGFQTRVASDESAIADYAEAIRAKGSWPFQPITVVSGFVVDGFHRVAAVKQVIADPDTPMELRKAIQSIPCERIAIDHLQDSVRDIAMLYALAANQTHGVRLTPADKRRRVELAIKQWPDKSDRDIARFTFTSHPFVARIRRSQSEALPHDTNAHSTSNELQVETLPPRSELKSSANPSQVETLPLPLEIGVTRPTSNDERRSTTVEAKRSLECKPYQPEALRKDNSDRVSTTVISDEARAKLPPLNGLIKSAMSALGNLNSAANSMGKHLGKRFYEHELRPHLDALDQVLAECRKRAERKDDWL